METIDYQGAAQAAEITGFVVVYLLRMDRVDAAEKIAEEACERNPQSALLHLLLANVHIRKHDYPALLQDLNTFLKLEPKGLTSEQVRQTREKLQRALANAQRAPLAEAPKL